MSHKTSAFAHFAVAAASVGIAHWGLSGAWDAAQQAFTAGNAASVLGKGGAGIVAGLTALNSSYSILYHAACDALKDRRPS